MCCVVIDPKDSNTIWVGSGENASQRSAHFGDGVYKSTDAGKSWKNVGLKTSEHTGKIVIDPRNSNVVWVAAQGPLFTEGGGGDRGLYKTTDGGASWTRVLNVSDDTGISDIVFDPKNADVIYASSYQRRRAVGQAHHRCPRRPPGPPRRRRSSGRKRWRRCPPNGGRCW